MAIVWADGFGTYGDTANFRQSGLYVYNTNDADEPLQIGTGANARTGNAYWYVGDCVYPYWNGGKMVGGNRNTLGVGAAFRIRYMPSDSYFCPIMFCGDGKSDFQVMIALNADGSLGVLFGDDGNGPQVVKTAPGVIVPGAYAYIEAKCFSDPVHGTVEIRVNNQTRALITEVNTAAYGYSRLNGFAVGRNSRGGNNGNCPCDAVADLVIWDTTGAYNNDFIGDVRCRTFFPTSNGPVQDWAQNAGAAWQAIDNVPFDPAYYVSANAVGQTSNFGKDALPTNTAYVAAVQLFAVVNKTDAGTCEVTPQLLNAGDVADGDAISPGTGSAVYTTRFQVDPNTGNTFTRLGFDATLMQVERTA